MNKSDGERLGKVLTGLKKSWSKGTCLYPLAPMGCNGKPINSHSIQRSQALKAIAVNGHLLKFQVDTAALLKAGLNNRHHEHPSRSLLSSMRTANAFEPQMVGIADASVFPGFCGNHDNDTFAPIEERPLIYDDEQCFLFTYRAACMELWAKRAKLATLQTTLSAIGQQGAFSDYEQVDNLAMQEHLQRKISLDTLLLTKTFADVHALVIEFDENPWFAATGVFAPEIDFADHPLQDVNDLETPLEHISFSILPSEKGGHAIMSWHGKSEVAEKFCASFLSLGSAEWGDALLRVAFESLENTYFSPDWWHLLTNHRKQSIALRANTGGLSFRPISYKPDGIHIVTFNTAILRQP